MFPGIARWSLILFPSHLIYAFYLLSFNIDKDLRSFKLKM